MLFQFLFAVQVIVAAALVGVILMQKSEGGGLGVGGNPSGLMSARGAADLLTRATATLAVLFVGLSIALAVIAAETHGGSSIGETIDRSAGTEAPADPATSNPMELPSAAPAAAPSGENSPDNANPLDKTGE